MTFDEYVLARGPGLVRFARLLTGDEHRAEDPVQDVLASAYVRWRRVGGLDRPDLYVRRMVINTHLSWRRRLASSWRVSCVTISS
ncbi:sigma factor [Catenuloplanes sp. NPDC051500]|uniref:sigma factor n=1 Tax=Catenuloplanes sp. NPDC051500 TaxID=3363959 RepID=UPI0037B1D5DC